MTVFIDTSAFLALLEPGDRFHRAAAEAFGELKQSNEQLTTHNYLLVEAVSLAHRRLGASAARTLLDDFIPGLDLVWVDPATHAFSVSALLAALPTRVSLVDFVSYQVMRQQGLDRAFTFDSDFAKAGFRVFPENVP